MEMQVYESARLQALEAYGVSDVLQDQGFERLVRLAASIFEVPIALVSLVEAQRQLFAAGVGLEVCETSRESSFCAHALLGDALLVVPNALEDSRFKENPLVLGPPHIRFYAGCPLIGSAGYVLGTLCIIDIKPRDPLGPRDAANLRDLAALVIDKLELRRLDIARQASQSRFENMADISPDAIVCIDDQARVTFWNLAAEKMLGYSAQDMLGRSIDIVTPSNSVAELLAIADDDASLSTGRTLDLHLHADDGSQVPVEVSASMWREDGRASFCAIFRDVTERRRNEARLFRLAHIDPLTELPNRVYLRGQMESALTAESDACVMMVDLDGFKDINDTLGHAGGDALLIATARRMQRSLRGSDIVARMGGDEFAIFMAGSEQVGQAGNIADQLIAVLSEPFVVDGVSVTIGASIGISLFPAHGATVQDLLSSADLALYDAKSNGKHCRRFFRPALREAAATRRAYQSEIARALQNAEFELFYQPQVRLEDEVVVGAEALLRWHHPDKGLLTPAAFLPALESSPLSDRVGRWVLQTACRQASVWRQTIPDFFIGVNVFGAQFQSGDLAEQALLCLKRLNLPPDALELEIAESTILRQNDYVKETLAALRESGVALAFDDYGTGSASLSMLKDLPLTRLKIDKSFVHGLLDSKADAAIIRVILYLARSLGFKVTAEGVETQEQRDRLRAKGCEQAQGFLFGKPMSADDFSERFLTKASGQTP